MTRKHFVALAQLVNDRKGLIPTAALESLARDLADFCQQQNSNFDRQRFLDACGVG